MPKMDRFLRTHAHMLSAATARNHATLRPLTAATRRGWARPADALAQPLDGAVAAGAHAVDVRARSPRG